MTECRCDICGQFIGLDELENKTAYSTRHAPVNDPYQLEVGYTSYVHVRCKRWTLYGKTYKLDPVTKKTVELLVPIEGDGVERTKDFFWLNAKNLSFTL